MFIIPHEIKMIKIAWDRFSKSEWHTYNIFVEIKRQILTIQDHPC